MRYTFIPNDVIKHYYMNRLNKKIKRSKREESIAVSLKKENKDEREDTT